MYSHFPIHLTWNAESIVESLVRRDIDAKVRGGEVVILVPPKQPQTMIGRLLRKLFRPQPFYITIAFCAEKFIRNVEIKYDPLKGLDDHYFDTIQSVLSDHGVLNEDDRIIAGRYCANSDELTKLLDRSEHLQSKKEELVANHDFENANEVRRAEEIVRQEIDAMLFTLVAR